jgi:hypothetical protein
MFGNTKLLFIFDSAIRSLIIKTRLAPEYKCHNDYVRLSYVSAQIEQ